MSGGLEQLHLRNWLGAVPGIGAALLAKFACPACWPLYTGALGAVGIELAGPTAYRLPLTVVVLTLALGSLAYAARQGRGYGPLAAGAIGSLAIAVGEFVVATSTISLPGVALLVGASLWAAWPRRTGAPQCPACESAATLARGETSPERS